MKKNRWFNQDGADRPEELEDRPNGTNGTNGTNGNGETPGADAINCYDCVEGVPTAVVSVVSGACPNNYTANPDDACEGKETTDDTTLPMWQADCWWCENGQTLYDTYEFPDGFDFTCPEGTSGEALAYGENPCLVEPSVVVPQTAGIGDEQKKLLLYVGLGVLAYFLYTAYATPPLRPRPYYGT